MSEPGALITFEGGEGSGKSTQARLLAERLERGGVRVVAVREPGGTAVGEAVRTLLLDTSHSAMDATAELLLYEASRAQLVAEVVRPALRSGAVVVCDRFVDSTTAYQGHGRGLPVELVLSLNEAASGGRMPDLTVLVDVDPVLGLARCGESPDRLESEDLEFHRRVREGFLHIARQAPERVVVIDGAPSERQVAEEIRLAVARALPRLRPALEPGPS